ncbi:MAG: cold shock domain-containing protein [Nanoarchaeota archaeon]|nr:cold shock domain-containing protein [Nanoarchaeota archaeon]
MKGKIEKWLDDKNFGFIDIGEKRGLFFHKNEVIGDYSPQEGDLVEFEKSQSEKGPMATKVKKADESTETKEVKEEVEESNEESEDEEKPEDE